MNGNMTQKPCSWFMNFCTGRLHWSKKWSWPPQCSCKHSSTGDGNSFSFAIWKVQWKAQEGDEDIHISSLVKCIEGNRDKTQDRSSQRDLPGTAGRNFAWRFSVVPALLLYFKLLRASAKWSKAGAPRVLLPGMFLLSCRIQNHGQELWETVFCWLTCSWSCSGVLWGRCTGFIVPMGLFERRSSKQPLPT